MKIIGFIILVVTGFVGGYFFYEQYTLQIDFLNQYIELITIIKNTILYSKTPLKKIISNFKFKNPINQNIKTCLINLENNTFAQSWQESFGGNYGIKLNLLPELKNLIADFGQQLGTSDSISQAKICEQHIELIKPYLQQAIQNKNKKGKLPLILGTSLGITIAILLV